MRTENSQQILIYKLLALVIPRITYDGKKVMRKKNQIVVNILPEASDRVTYTYKTIQNHIQ